MAQIEVLTTIKIKDTNGQSREMNFRAVISGLTSIETKEWAIAADGTQVLWDPTTDSSEAASTFDFLLAVADGTLDLETTTNEGHASEELSSVRLYKGLPFMLGADDSYYGHAASNAFGGTLDVIDKLRADEPATAARKLTTIIAT